MRKKGPKRRQERTLRVHKNVIEINPNISVTIVINELLKVEIF